MSKLLSCVAVAVGLLLIVIAGGLPNELSSQQSHEMLRVIVGGLGLACLSGFWALVPFRHQSLRRLFVLAHVWITLGLGMIPVFSYATSRPEYMAVVIMAICLRMMPSLSAQFREAMKEI